MWTPHMEEVIGRTIQVQVVALRTTTPAVTGDHARCRFIGLPVAGVGRSASAGGSLRVNPHAVLVHNRRPCGVYEIFSSDPPMKW